MKWKGRKRSSNVEDRRGQSSSGRGGGVNLPNFRGLGGGKSKMGCGTIVLIAIAFMVLKNSFNFTGDSSGMSQIEQGQQKDFPRYQPPQYRDNSAQGDRYSTQERSDGNIYTKDDGTELDDFLGVVLQDTEDVWNYIFSEHLGRNYQEPKMVLFERQTSSACGHASSATGPFYCPGDNKLYLDLSFYTDLKNKFKAPGDFAMAYVVAHEVAHHVQNQLGATDYVNQYRGRISKEQQNALSVRLELQADFYAGVWAHHMVQQGQIIEVGDIEEALTAASAIGDDRIQQQSRGYVVPDSFTHGTSEQRMRWFRKGFETGDISQGDTFNARNL